MKIDSSIPLEDQFPIHSQFGNHKDWPKWLSNEWNQTRKRRHLMWCHNQAQRWQDNPNGTVTLTSTHGRKLTLDNGWMARELMRDNLVFQCQNTKKFHELLKTKSGIILDIGANIGAMSLEYASWGRSVQAFEPDPHAFSLLRKNISDNHSPVICNNIGFGITNEFMKFESLKGESLGQSRINPKGDVCIEIKRLDDFVFDPIAGIKIDCEGYDYLVLKGAVETIKKHRPIIQFEANNSHLRRYFHHSNDIIELLHTFDYQIQDIAGEDVNDNKRNCDLWGIPK